MSVIDATPDLTFDPKAAAAETESTQKSSDKRLKIEPVPLEFPALINTLATDTNSMASIINSLFRPVFSQYKGSKIEVVQNRQLQCSIFFVDKAPEEGKYKAIQSIINKDNDSTENRIFAMNQFNSFKSGNRKMYKLTDDAKELLYDFIPSNFFNRDGKVNWGNVVREGTYQTVPFQQEIYVQVAVDLYKVLKAIYGSKSEDGGHWNYLLNVNYPINNSNMMIAQPVSNKWQLLIMRVNSKNVETLAAQYGFTMNSNQLGIVTK